MNRRDLFASLACGLAVLSPAQKLLAEQDCQTSPYGPVCQSYIPLNRLTKIYAIQTKSQWCWAACISMIFDFHDHPIDQRRIVRDAYGSDVNMPGNYPALFGSLNRTWTDNSGDEFDVSINNLFAPDFGIANLSNATLAEELNDENPILYCTMQHAMILTSMRYVGGNVIEAWVMDPYPGRGLRPLNRREMVPVYLGGELRMAATISID